MEWGQKMSATSSNAENIYKVHLYPAHCLFGQSFHFHNFLLPLSRREQLGVRVGWGGTQARFEVYKSWILPKFQQDYTHA